MNIWIAALLGVIVGIVLGIIIYWAASEDEGEQKVHDLKNEAVGLFMERQVETNKIVTHRLDIVMRKLNILEQDLRFCPKIRDSFFQKEEDDQ